MTAAGQWPGVPTNDVSGRREDPIWDRVRRVGGHKPAEIVYLDRSAIALPEVPTEATTLGIWDAGDDDYKIPPRGWLLGTAFCRGFLSALLADGGTGKTALRIAQLLSLATGRSLTGEHVFSRSRVLILSLEDSRDELRRRTYAAMRHHGVSAEDVAGWLFLSAPVGLRLAEMVDGAPAAAELLGLLRKTIADLKIDVVTIDPFIKSHSLPENDNAAVGFACTLLTQLAIEADVAIGIVHHTRKGAGSPGDVDRARGASSMKDAARLAHTITQASPEEAAEFGITERERRSLIRLDFAKLNIAPSAGDAQWFRLVGVPLDNGTEAYPSGDHVQTVEIWTPPRIWDGLDNVLLNLVLDDLDRGLDNGQRYSGAGPASRRAAWSVVQRHAPTKTEDQCRRVIGTWLRSGTLFTENYFDPLDHKQRTGLRVNPNRRPS